jgi:ribosome-associated protein
VLCSTTNERQSKAIADGIVAEMKANDVKVFSNGHNTRDGRWVLQDLGDVVVHVFQSDARTFYDLDGLWADAKLIAWQPAKKAKRPVGEHGGAAAH